METTSWDEHDRIYGYPGPDEVHAGPDDDEIYVSNDGQPDVGSQLSRIRSR